MVATVLLGSSSSCLVVSTVSSFIMYLSARQIDIHLSTVNAVSLSIAGKKVLLLLTVGGTGQYYCQISPPPSEYWHNIDQCLEGYCRKNLIFLQPNHFSQDLISFMFFFCVENLFPPWLPFKMFSLLDSPWFSFIFWKNYINLLNSHWFFFKFTKSFPKIWRSETTVGLMDM